MASNTFQIVVQGEASETDSDEEVYITSLPAHSAATGVKVAGEASETDSDGEVENAKRPVIAGISGNSHYLAKELPPLIVIRNESDFVSGLEDRTSLPRTEHGAHCNTLLQQKLQESNARLCSDVTQTVVQVYHNAAKEIRMATTHLNNSQSGIINASHNIRLILEDLKCVSEKIDIITTCNLLPEITIPTPFPAQ